MWEAKCYSIFYFCLALGRIPDKRDTDLKTYGCSISRENAVPSRQLDDQVIVDGHGESAQFFVFNYLTNYFIGIEGIWIIKRAWVWVSIWRVPYCQSPLTI